MTTKWTAQCTKIFAHPSVRYDTWLASSRVWHPHSRRHNPRGNKGVIAPVAADKRLRLSPLFDQLRSRACMCRNGVSFGHSCVRIRISPRLGQWKLVEFDGEWDEPIVFWWLDCGVVGIRLWLDYRVEDKRFDMTKDKGLFACIGSGGRLVAR